METGRHSWLICVVLPLMFVGLVGWLSPALMSIEGPVFDHFVSKRPPLQLPTRIFVAYVDGASQSPAPAQSLPRTAKGTKGWAAILNMLSRMHGQAPAASRPTGPHTDREAAASPSLMSLASESKFLESGLLPQAIVFAPMPGKAYVRERGAVLWWDVSRSYGEVVRVWPADELPPEKPGRGQVLIVTLRPLADRPLWASDGLRALNWYGGASSFPRIDVNALVSGRIPREKLEGSAIVFARPGNIKRTPLGPMPEAAVSANLVATMLDGRWLKPLPSSLYWIIVLVSAIIAATLVTRTSTLTAMAAVVLEVVVLVLVALASLNHDRWFCLTPALAALGLSAGAALLFSLEASRSSMRHFRREAAWRKDLLGVIAEDLQSSRDQLRRLTDSLPDPVFELDVDYRITYANKAARGLLGYSGYDVARGISLDDLLSPMAAERAKRKLSEAAESGGTTVGLYQLLRRDGSPVPCEAHTAPIRDSAGRLQGFRGIFRELSQRRQLEDAQRMATVGQLAAGVAHEFNNVLGAMLLRAEFAQRQGTPEAYEALVATVIASVEQGARISRQLSRAARPQRPEVKLAKLEEPLDAALDMAQRELEYRQVAVVKRYGPGNTFVHCDVAQIEQVFLNLILNACHAMPDGGTLTVTVAPAESGNGAGEVVATVTDTGYGIPADVLPRIFEPFFSTRGDREGPDKGTGLGLSVSRGILSAHGGEIGVRSEVGKGTTFEIRLPAVSDKIQQKVAERPTETRKESTRTGGANLDVLVVTDDAAFRRAVGDVLLSEGHSVVTASDSPQAVRHLTRRRFDVVISDLVLPTGSGAQVLAAARSNKPQPFFILVSGMLDLDPDSYLSDVGVSAYLQKPFDLDKLTEVLRRATGQA